MASTQKFKQRKSATLTSAAAMFALFLVAAAIFAGCGDKPAQLSTADQQKVSALNDALKSGVITQQEYDTKMKQFAGAASSSSTAAATSSSTPTSVVNASNSASAAGPSDFGPMKTVDIIDPLFNMVAYTIQIPASWQFEGTVLHGPGCMVEWSSVAFRAYSPDLLYGVQAFPSSEFYWADDKRAIPQGKDCKALPPVSAEDYGKLVSIRMRPGAEVDSVKTSPNEPMYQANIEKSNQALAAQAASQGNRFPSKYKGELKMLHIHYDFNGHPEEEWMSVAMSVGDMPTSTMVNEPGKMMQLEMKHRMISTAIVSGARTPQGQYQPHEAALRAIGMSMKANPDYNAKYAAYMQDRTNRAIAASWAVTNAILAKGAQQQAQRTQQAQQFIQNMQQEGDVRRQNFNAQMDRKSAHAQDVCDYLLDQQLYVNPTTGETSKASNQYNHTYSNGDAIIQTNAYNPNGLLQGNWTELQPIHH